MPPFSSSEAGMVVVGDCPVPVCRSSEDSSTSATSVSSTTDNTTNIPPVIKCPSIRSTVRSSSAVGESTTSTSSSSLSTTQEGDDGVEERHVSFNAVVQVMEVLNKDQYHRSEKLNTWYSEHELLRIQRESVNVCKRVELGCPWPEDCTRGLEYHTPEGYNRVRKHRLLSRFAVLEEQKKLQAAAAASAGSTKRLVRKASATDAVAAAVAKSSVLIGGKLYRTISEKCMEEAIRLAEQDAIDAQNYHLEPASTTTLTERFKELEGEEFDCEDFKCMFLLDPAKWLSVFFRKPLITE